MSDAALGSAEPHVQGGNRAALFLLSSEAYVSGTQLYVDNGFSAMLFTHQADVK